MKYDFTKFLSISTLLVESGVYPLYNDDPIILVDSNLNIIGIGDVTFYGNITPSFHLRVVSATYIFSVRYPYPHFNPITN